MKFAMKTLDKWEMQERNKVARVLTPVAACRFPSLQGTDMKFAMKTLDKWEMQERNKVARVLTEESILTAIDHPFLATCYCTIQTDSHLHFVMEFCEGGELYGLLNAQPRKRLKESHVK
jgi:serine/threonine protein kinase